MYAMGHRYTEADFHTGMTRAEAKAKGLTRKRSGTLRMYFNGALLMEAYSYNTCIMARMAPCEDFPYGRMILNETNYGPTSSKHMGSVMDAVKGFATRINEWSKGGEHETAYIENCDYTHRAILIDMCMGLSANDLQDAVTCMQRSAAYDRANNRTRRLVRIAAIKEYNRTVDDYNATHNHANVILFPGSAK